MVSVYDKMRQANDREERLYQRKINTLMRDHADILASLNRNKVVLVQEVRAHKCREMRKHVCNVIKRETTTPHVECRADLPHSTQTIINPRFLSGNQGFSKILIKVPKMECESMSEKSSDRTKVKSRMRANTSIGGRSDLQNPRPRPLTPGTDPVIIYYPSDTKKNGKQRSDNIEDNDGDAETFVGDQLLVLGAKGSPLKCMLPPETQKRRPMRPYPSYVERLQNIDQEAYDQYTDGSMAYEMRLSRRKQKERLPTLAGHLPVRSRNPEAVDPLENLTRIRESILGGEHAGGRVATAFLQRGHSLAVLDPRKVHPFVAPSSQQNEAEIERREVERENIRLQRLRTAGQRLQYQRCLEKTSEFLGWTPWSTSLVQVEHLTQEEQLMLNMIQSTTAPAGLVTA